MEIEDLKKNKQWVNWKREKDDKGKVKKVPYCYKGFRTSANIKDKSKWCDFVTAEKSYKDNKFDGIGLTFDNGVCGIDIDDRNIDDPIVQEIIKLMDTYTEISPSGNGIHLLFTVDFNKLPNDYKDRYYQKNITLKIECYLAGVTSRFFTFTGNSLNNKTICERTNELLTFLDKYMVKDIPLQDNATNNVVGNKTDDEIIDIIRKSKQADKFSKLFDEGDLTLFNDDHSSADESLCCIIAYYTKDFNQIDRIFRKSALYRDLKWNRQDYRTNTIKKALSFANNSNEDISDLQYISAKELQTKDLPPTIYYVDKILPQGLNLICSVPKMGKSWLALDLCLSICNGTSFLGFNTRQAGCLYLALEDSYNRLKERTNKLLGSTQAPNNFIYSINCEDLQHGFVKQIEKFLKVNKDIKVIIIDTLQKIRSESKNSNAYGHDYKELSMIKQLADEKGLCIILIHHLKKGVTTDPFEKVSGTNRYYWNC